MRENSPSRFTILVSSGHRADQERERGGGTLPGLPQGYYKGENPKSGHGAERNKW